MSGTRYATPCVTIRGKTPGPTVMVLGGVHGNEPGSWRAGGALQHRGLESGTLIVAPCVNHLAAADFVRTFDDLGDLNRLYPGDPHGLPMERMAHEIVMLARAYSVDYLFDLHESWGFYADSPYDNAATRLGQLVVVGGDEAETEFMSGVVDAVNDRISEREQFYLRDRSYEAWSFIGLGASSISLGRDIPGCTPVLIETAQEDQPEERRAELHQMLISTVLERLEMA